MSSIHVIHYRESPLRSVARQAIRRLVYQAIQPPCHWLDRIDQRSALMELDDHLLRDIGKTRSQAEAEGRKPFWRR